MNRNIAVLMSTLRAAVIHVRRLQCFLLKRSRRNSNGITSYKCRWGGLKSATFDK